MSKIVIATFGSLGDTHPQIALGLELKSRGHQVVFSLMDYYREKIEKLGFEFRSMRPHIDTNDAELARRFMDAKTGTEMILKELIFAKIRETHEDLLANTTGADLMISGDLIYGAQTVSEINKIKWISTTLGPGSFFSAYDPFVPPLMPWFEKIRFLPPLFHKAFNQIVRFSISGWGKPLYDLREDLGLPKGKDPIFGAGRSPLLHLALFSKFLAEPQPDWAPSTFQTGFAFYDGNKDFGSTEEKLMEFIDSGEPPIIFTLGSAAVWDARDFYIESAKAAKILKRRAVLLIGENELPKDLSDEIVAFKYAPFGEVFPKAACVVHQGGIGTTSQVLRAGVPMLVMPFSHDQFDNAARCSRKRIGRWLYREKYRAELVAKELNEILANPNFKENAEKAKEIISNEDGAKTACDIIEQKLGSQ